MLLLEKTSPQLSTTIRLARKLGGENSMARALPLVNQPYHSIDRALRLLSAGPLPREAFVELYVASENVDIKLKESDVEGWLSRATDLVRLNRDSVQLTTTGIELAEQLGAPSFNCALLQHLVDRGRTRFSYFTEAKDCLDGLRKQGELVIPSADLTQRLNQVIANKTSGPIIRRLLVGLGALHSTDDGYELRDVCEGKDAMSLELRRLLQAAKQLVEVKEMSWAGLLNELRAQYGTDSVDQYSDELRGHAVITSTRAVEHVLDIRMEGGN